MNTDYLILGSGLSALAFASLMAKAGKKVTILEAHEYAGGYGHTFDEGHRYQFNAQLHYVWNCGEGRTVNQFLKKLNLHDQVTFEQYDVDGFDHMRMPGYALDIPADFDKLIDRLSRLFPQHMKNITNFVQEVQFTANELDNLPAPLRISSVLMNLVNNRHILKYRSATLQDVYDRFELPLEAQTLLALQWLDFMLPPRDLSFFAWVVLFAGYCRGAYYPTKHFEHVIDSLVRVIRDGHGEIIFSRKVTSFIAENRTIKGVFAEDLKHCGQIDEYYGMNVICNMDPQKAAEMIGFDNFSHRIRNKLTYDYSPSNFMAYCVVKGIDLREYGFGKWNLFHTEQRDLNKTFDDMYYRGDYTKPSFAVTVPGLLTDDNSDCPDGCQIVEFITVANYQRFLDLRIRNPHAYRQKKKEVFNAIIDVVERHYVPGLRDHFVFHMTGSPTTNERFCHSPQGNSYGSNMTPKNLGPNRLDHRTSLKNFYFCNASSGYAGFAGTIGTGCTLYEQLSGDSVLNGQHY